MNIARPVTLITVALMALSLGVVGCRKDLQKPATLQGRGPGRGIAGEQPGGIIGSTPVQPDRGTAIPETPTGTTVGDPTQGLKAAVGEWDKWFENPKEFQEQTVYFDFDKANVKPSEISKLKEVARRMKTFKDKALRIDGHCDERGTEEYNRALGDRRALSTREKLVSLGLDPKMLPTVTYGKERPAEPGHNAAAWAKNRRAELILLSPPGAN